MAERQPNDDSFLKAAEVMRRYDVSKILITRHFASDPTFHVRTSSTRRC
jgi:hypothetical protein